MKFAFSLKNKIKIAFLLFCIMCCTLLIRFLEDKSIKKINESFISMYNDRLVPVTDLYNISENLNRKNLLLKDLVSEKKNQLNITAQIKLIKKCNYNIDSIMNKYGKTLLVKQEAQLLTDFRYAVTNQQKTEDKILSLLHSDPKTASILYDNMEMKSSSEFLSALIKMQSQVGVILLKDSEVFILGTKIYSTLQVILAIAIGILIVGIVSASNAVKIQNDKFNLN